jgi:signal peptidase I
MVRTDLPDTESDRRAAAPTDSSRPTGPTARTDWGWILPEDLAASRKPAAGTASGRRARRFHRLPIVLALAAIAVLVLGVLGWRLQGGNWLIVSTPSMGEAAPVGTLLLTEPVGAGGVHVGDIVSYRSPTGNGTVYTHRVVEVVDNGGFRVRGDANAAADPWTLHDSDLIGVVVARLQGVGFLFKALPMWVAGGLVLWFVSARWMSSRWRSPTRLVGAAVLFSIAAVVFRPFVKLIGITTYSDAAGTHLQIVSAGLFPIRVTADTGGSVDLVDGQVATILTHPPADVSGVQLTAALHLSIWQWVLMGLFWLTPLWWALLVARFDPADEHNDHDEPRRPGPGGRRRVVDLMPGHPWVGSTPGSAAARHQLRRGHRAQGRGLVTVATLIALAAGGVAVQGTASAFTGVITNTADTVSTNAFFTCTSAASGTSAYYAYPLNDYTTNGNAADVSGNNRTGQWGGTATNNGAKACTRDAATTSATMTVAGAGFVSTPTSFTNPSTFSEEIWFKTTATAGRLMGFSGSQRGLSLNYDRMLYIDPSGTVSFGVANAANAHLTVSSTKTVNDGNWHQVVATLSPTAGASLYVDGALVAADATITAGQNYTGWWRIGYDNMSGWPGSAGFAGNLAYASVYTAALTAAQVKAHWIAGN